MGQTHLFFQGDQGSGTLAGGGGSYQLTPVHRISKWTGQYAALPGGRINFGAEILFAPLLSEEPGLGNVYLVNIQMYQPVTGGAVRTLVQGLDYTVSPNRIEIIDPASWAVAAPTLSHIDLTYVHSGHIS